MGMRNVSLRFPPFRPLSAGRRFIAVYGGTHLFETCTAAPAGGGSRTGANRWNHFVKPSAELNAVRAMARREMDERSSTISLSRAQNRTLFGLCRGEKWTKKIQGYSSPVGFMETGVSATRILPCFCVFGARNYFAKPLPMARKSSALSAAPPIRPPSTSSLAKISAALDGLHDPP